MKSKLLICSLLLLLLAACGKNEEVIPNNVPPPDHTLDPAAKEVYVTKVYISLLGREPVGTEKADALAILNADNFSVSARQQFIQTLFAKPEYPVNQYTVVRGELLQNLDTNEIGVQIYIYGTLLQNPAYAAFYDLINYEIARLQAMQTIQPGLNNGSMSQKQLLRICADNYFYDQLNMGTENFVVSTFQNFFFRYPSDEELLIGKSMVDGQVATLFFQIGQSKDDYLDIFFDSDNYYEGQVRYVFTKFLFREPSSAEISLYAGTYKQSQDYKRLQKEVLSLDEYAGVK